MRSLGINSELLNTVIRKGKPTSCSLSGEPLRTEAAGTQHFAIPFPNGVAVIAVTGLVPLCDRSQGEIR